MFDFKYNLDNLSENTVRIQHSFFSPLFITSLSPALLPLSVSRKTQFPSIPQMNLHSELVNSFCTS